MFGAVHPWAGRPLMAAVSIAGCWLWMRGTDGRRSPGLRIAAAALLLPVALQLVPLSPSVLLAVAPANDSLIRLSQLGGTFLPARWRALSVAPELTASALVFLLAGVLWVGGLTRSTGRLKAAAAANGVMWLGLLVAVFALVQKATFNGKIYWFWESEFRFAGNYYGPFVNRNHFAGWMLLAFALTAGHLTGMLAAARDQVRGGWRARVLWCGSQAGAAALFAATAAAVMIVSLIWSLSRSGIAGSGIAVLVLTVAVLFRFRSHSGRIAAAASVACLFAAAVAWKGLDVLAAWYGNTHTLEWRFALWRDSFAPLRDFVVLGSGLNTYGRVMLVYPQTDATVHAQQAHNDYLQLAIEGGVVTVLAWTCAAALIGRLVARRLAEPQDEHTWWIRMGAVAGVCGMAVQEMTEFSLQIPGVALLFATLLGLALQEAAPLRSRRHGGPRPLERTAAIATLGPALAAPPSAGARRFGGSAPGIIVAPSQLHIDRQ